MKKDVIYIDTEDDITSIIEKVKLAKEKIIALVPPKRPGVLQSAVNLKLLHKAAHSVDRRVVLITSDRSLSMLAAGVQIPVAKTLQSRPELATVALPFDHNEEEVINGEDLPVGELARTAPVPRKSSSDEEIELPPDLGDSGLAKKDKKKGKKGAPSVPNFGKFRKRLIFGGIAAVGLTAFLVWAIVFAPHATVNIKAKTTNVDVELPVTLINTADTDISQNIIKPTIQQIKNTNSLEFNATGKKDVGEKATGSVTISNCGSRDTVSIPAGTAVSSDGLNFMTASAVKVRGGSSSSPFGGCDRPGTATVSVTAQEVGEQYNIASGSDFTVADQGSGIAATNKSPFSGGSKRQITIVSEGDVATAKQGLLSQDQETIKSQLEDKFDDNYIVIDESFVASPGEPVIDPAIGAEASRAKITQEVTYTLFGISKKDAKSAVNGFLKEKIKGEANQRVYDEGINKLKVGEYAATAEGATLQFRTSGSVGPTIDVESIKSQLVGKNYEEIRQRIKLIDGVDDVDTKFSPFWVGSVSSEEKITIKFNVSNK